MNKNVVVTLSDHLYIENVISLYSNLKNVGIDEFDFVVIIPEENYNKLTTDIILLLKKIGIIVFIPKNLPENPPVHFYKIFLFDTFFEKYNWIYYTDLDVIYFNKLDLSLEKRNKNNFYANVDAMTFMEHFKGFKNKRVLTDIQKKIVTDLEKKYAGKDAIHSCFMLFNKKLIELNYFQKLYDAYLTYYLKYELAYTSWWEQSILNLVLFDIWKPLGDNFINRWPAVDAYKWDKEKYRFDTTDYSSNICLHFFHQCPPWDRSNVYYYPIWLRNLKVYLDKPIRNRII